MPVQKYFNFPIVLLKDFMLEHKKCLNEILAYASFAHISKVSEPSPDDVNEAETYLGFRAGSHKLLFDLGKDLHQNTPPNSPMVGIRSGIFWQFLKEKKTDFEKISMLGFLAAKSIIGPKIYCKTNNLYWLARMDGKSHTVSSADDLTAPIRRYASEYQTKKIKNELELNWGLKYYSRYTRGFFISFSMSKKNLIYTAEKKRRSTMIKLKKQKEKELVLAVLARVESESV